jgi:hypothetical protein
MNDETDLEAAHALERKIMNVVLGHKDYIIMSAMTFATASLLIWAYDSMYDGHTMDDALDLMDEQLRDAVKGALERKKRQLS